MGSGVNRCAVGSVTGTGSAIDVKTAGFRPRYVKLLNVGGNCKAEWTVDMADASMQKTVDSGTGTSDISFVTSDGVTPLSTGFKIGADSDLNASGELIHWVAFE